MAPPVKCSKALINFICDKIEDGMVLYQVCKQFPDQVPAEKTIYRWKKKYPEVKNALNDAYQTFFYKKIDELETLSREYEGLEKTINASDEDESRADFSKKILQARNHRDNVKMRINALQFILSKLAPKLVADLADQSRTNNQVIPNITIMNFKDPSSN